MITETAYPDPRPLTGRAVVYRKLRTNEVHSIDTVDLRRLGALPPGPSLTTYSSTRGPSRVRAVVLPKHPDVQAAVFVHSRLVSDPDSPLVSYPVLLDATRCHFGGYRYWFECPVGTGGQCCGRRCRILYRPYGAERFGCRECSRLTYESRQFHRDWLWETLTRPLDALIALEPILRSSRPSKKRTRAIRAARRALVASGCAEAGAFDG